MSEPSRVQVRTPGAEDAEQMAALLGRAFGRWPDFELPVSPVEHLRWKMRSHPLAMRQHLVAEVDGRIVGMILRIARKLRIRGADYLARDGVDMAVDPDVQGRGIYNALHAHWRDHLECDFDLAMSFTTNPILDRTREVRRHVVLGNRVEVLVKPLDVARTIAGRRERYAARRAAGLSAAKLRLRAAANAAVNPPALRKAAVSWPIVTLDAFDERLDAFFEEAARPFDFIALRNADSLNWRYAEPAAGRFTLRAVRDGGGILGYLVLKLANGEGYVTDLLALPGRLDVVQSLLDDALRICREADVAAVNAWTPSQHPYRRLLHRQGFVDTRQPTGFQCRPMTLARETLAFLAEPRARVHLALGDSDWV